jgi:hypothetical protein
VFGPQKQKKGQVTKKERREVGLGTLKTVQFTGLDTLLRIERERERERERVTREAA